MSSKRISRERSSARLPLQRFDRSQIVTFLHALDHYLEDTLEIFVIGGVAAILGFHATARTADIDIYAVEGDKKDLERAIKLAFADTGIFITIDPATVAELPYNYEDRIRSVRDVKFKKLNVRIPDKYDLVLSKALRASPHDLEVILEIHAHHTLSEKTLAKRFEDEIWELATMDPKRFAQNMVLVMYTLFGKEIALHYKQRWAEPPGYSR